MLYRATHRPARYSRSQLHNPLPAGPAPLPTAPHRLASEVRSAGLGHSEHQNMPQNIINIIIKTSFYNTTIRSIKRFARARTSFPRCGRGMCCGIGWRRRVGTGQGRWCGGQTGQYWRSGQPHWSAPPLVLVSRQDTQDTAPPRHRRHHRSG